MPHTWFLHSRSIPPNTVQILQERKFFYGFIKLLISNISPKRSELEIQLKTKVWEGCTKFSFHLSTLHPNKTDKHVQGQSMGKVQVLTSFDSKNQVWFRHQIHFHLHTYCKYLLTHTHTEPQIEGCAMCVHTRSCCSTANI